MAYEDKDGGIVYGNPPRLKPDFSTVAEFENKIAEFFGAPYAVAVDSCTHGLELCLRMYKTPRISVPKKTYLSVPMLAKKMGIRLIWSDRNWNKYYRINHSFDTLRLFDAATLWELKSYVPESFMCLSFQHQKHLSLGRGGMILCDNKESAEQLRKMSYDGRLPGIPWREQDIDTMGYHYYMTPETAQLGLDKLEVAKIAVPRVWSSEDYPDISKFKVFNK